MSASLPSWARVGAKVVCTHVYFHTRDIQRVLAPNVPEVNGIYTIRRVEWYADELGVWLDEVVNPLETESGWETGFHLRHFRPVHSLKTEAEDAALFRTLLHQPVEGERV